MRIAIIGGSGFIGTRLAERLQRSGRDFRILDIAKSHFFPERWEAADVRDPGSLEAGLRGCDLVVNLAAQHRDDVRPLSLYADVNVSGAENVCRAAERLGIGKIVFTSSVAVYGFAPAGTAEDGACAPFNEYGKTKLAAEAAYRSWLSRGADRSLAIVRPTVVFGERNRGNVYNLLSFIASRHFVMVGNGANTKSMAYVENVAAFLEHCMGLGPGEHLYNYVDKPDFDMNRLVRKVNSLLGRGDRVGPRFPYAMGYVGGLCFDALSAVTGKRFPVSSIRIKKFCATTSFSADKAMASGFRPPATLEEGISRTVGFEFLGEGKGGDGHVFKTE